MTTAVLPESLTREQLRSAYRVMRTIRQFEERLHQEAATGELPGAVHLYAGQEAIAAGVIARLNRDDYISSTHRGHGHAIAKGCDLTAMMLEIYGKAGGLCGGKGGSMHIADFDLGMLGANGVAGSSAPKICGVGLSARVRGTDQVGVAFVGDGGANQGAFLESLCLASVWQLPCVFVVEDNGYAQTTATSFHLRGLDVAARAPGFGVPAEVVDGQDFFAVHKAAGQAIERARAGGGPSLLDCKTTRYFGHMEGFDAQAYRAPGEVEQIRSARDCIDRFISRVLDSGLLSAADLEDIDDDAREQVEAAVQAAKAAGEPAPADAFTDVYATP
jgi:acetoin:2,6-dichlorophenolindophenol oxidoreductase subunit alpha